MAIKPVVRYMLLCDDWQPDPDNPRSINIFGLLSNIRVADDPPFPFLLREMCVLLILTEGYGQGAGRIICVDDENGRTVFETPPRSIRFGSDPLAIIGVSFRILDSSYPKAGLYSMQFWYEGELVEDRPLRLR